MTDTRRQETERLCVRLPLRLAAALDEAARDDERTRSDYVRELLRRELRQRRGAAA